MTDALYGVDSNEGFDSIASDLVKPPTGLAVAAVVLALFSLASASSFRGHAAFIGWGLGFGALIAGVAYRWLLRQRQVEPNYLPNKTSDRLMLAGVFVGFIGIVLNAVLIAQRSM